MGRKKNDTVFSVIILFSAAKVQIISQNTKTFCRFYSFFAMLSEVNNYLKSITGGCNYRK